LCAVRTRQTLLGGLVLAASLAGTPSDAGAGIPPDLAILEVTVDPAAPVYPTDVTVTVSGITAECTVVEVNIRPILDDVDFMAPGPPVATEIVELLPEDDGSWLAALAVEVPLPGDYRVSAMCPDAERSVEFAVAPPPDFEMTIDPREDAAGAAGTIRVAGGGCVYPLVQVAFDPVDTPLLGMVSDRDLSPNPDGSWSTEISHLASSPPGGYRVFARCGDSTGFGRHVYYESQTYTLTGAPPPSTSPPPAPPQPDPPDFTG
jgi:hypothetical protein